MRIGALLFTVIGLLTAAACNGPAPDDEECVAQGGVCLAETNMNQCGEQLTTAANICPQSYTCCVPVAADAGAGSGTGAAPVVDSGATKD